MASVSAPAYTTNALNYQGVLIQIAPKETPLITKLLADGKIRPTGANVVNMAKEWESDTPAQPAISESAARTAPTVTSFLNTQSVNEKQIFQRQAEATYRKQADTVVSGTAVADQAMPENDALDSQIEKNMKNMKLDMEYSSINGTYQADGGSPTTASKMRGISTAISTNSVPGAGAALSTTMFDSLATKLSNAEVSGDLLLMCRANQLVRINQLYGNAIESVSVGGVRLTILHHAVGSFVLMVNNQVVNTEIVCVNYDWLSLAYTPTKGEFISVEDLEKTGASDKVQIYSDMCIDYTHETLHGKITNLLA